MAATSSACTPNTRRAQLDTKKKGISVETVNTCRVGHVRLSGQANRLAEMQEGKKMIERKEEEDGEEKGEESALTSDNPIRNSLPPISSRYKKRKLPMTINPMPITNIVYKKHSTLKDARNLLTSPHEGKGC